MAAIESSASIRLLTPDDSIAELTELLHRAYRALAERGMRFIASQQDEQTTRQRTARGECYVAATGGKLVGTITLRPCDRTHGSAWLDRPDVASVGQFAVDPAFQCCGIGSRLLRFAEQRAAILGATELALDTAEPAQDLIDFYAARGYRVIEHLQWPNVNYRSVVMSKTLASVHGSLVS